MGLESGKWFLLNSFEGGEQRVTDCTVGEWTEVDKKKHVLSLSLSLSLYESVSVWRTNQMRYYTSWVAAGCPVRPSVGMLVGPRLCGYQWSLSVADQSLVCVVEQKIATDSPAQPSPVNATTVALVDKVCFIGKLDRTVWQDPQTTVGWVLSACVYRARLASSQDFQLLRVSHVTTMHHLPNVSPIYTARPSLLVSIQALVS